ncbi:MAG: HigA family addiction module antitoxin [Pseudomonadota bacterium]
MKLKRRPIPPGEILEREFLQPLGLTQQQLADAIGISRVRANEIIRGKRGITADTAIRLSRYFGNSVEFWLGLQAEVDTWDALQHAKADYQKIKPRRTA